MALGLVMLCCVASFATVADMFLVRGGVISDEALRVYPIRTWAWSVNWLSDAAWFQYAVLLLTAAAAVCLVVGWHTRWATIFSWVLISSILNQAPPVVGGGDVLLNLLLFWAMFLPLGARWSLDARRRSEPEETSLVSAGTAAILLQMAMMYLFTGFSKCNDLWYSGSALDIGLSIDRITRPLGHLLAGYPWLTSLLTRGTLVVELILPLVLFSPWKANWCRSIALLMLIGFHVGIEATMVVVIFSYASLAGLTLFFPTVWWQYPPLKQLQGWLDRLFGVESCQPVEKPTGKKKDRRAKRTASGGLDLKQRFGRAAIVVCILYVFLYNVIVMFASADLKRSLGTFQRFGELLVLRQYWKMFSDPSPNCNDIACVARLRDGTQIDLLRRNVEVDYRRLRPAQPAKYDTLREMVFASVLAERKHKMHQKRFVEYLCRKYQESNADPEKEILDCYLMYYPYGAHPYAGQASFIQLIHVKLRG